MIFEDDEFMKASFIPRRLIVRTQEWPTMLHHREQQISTNSVTRITQPILRSVGRGGPAWVIQYPFFFFSPKIKLAV